MSRAIRLYDLIIHRIRAGMGRKKPRKGQGVGEWYNAPRAPHLPEGGPDQGHWREPMGRGLPGHGGRMVPGLVCGREPHMRVCMPHHRKGGTYSTPPSVPASPNPDEGLKAALPAVDPIN